MARRKTNEEFIKEVYDLVGDEYVFLEEYINKNTKIKCKHNKCGYQWDVFPGNFLKGHRCPLCNGGIKKTQIQFEQEIFNLVGNEYVVLGEYINASTPVTMRHNTCGHKYKIAPTSFLRGTRCPECFGRYSYTYDEVKYFVEIKSNSGCKLLSDKYINNSTKMLFKCSCGEKFKTSFSKFKNENKRQCNNCGYNMTSNKLTKTHEHFKQEVFDLTQNEYKVLGTYTGANDKITIMHVKCNHKFKMEPSNFLNGQRCPKCKGIKIGDALRKTHEEFKEEVYNLVQDEYEVMGEYKGSLTPITIKHNICNHEWDVLPANFTKGRGTRCPQCVESKGEQKIRFYIEDYKINFIQEYVFDNLIGVGGKPFRFDFAILDNNNTLLFLIEYDGEQHFEPINFGGSEVDKIRNFELTQKRDERKNQYCKNNNIPLLRIPYWEFDNIEQILEEWLEKYDLIHKNQNIA